MNSRSEREGWAKHYNRVALAAHASRFQSRAGSLLGRVVYSGRREIWGSSVNSGDEITHFELYLDPT